ncbi:MAG TPA: hypothetical protein VFI35_08180 [Actinomycetota bacterium]|nr:hypothetical protein [Actinomycetota bacterium]
MSAQGATLGRGTVHIPIWPVAVVVLAAAAAALIGLSSIDTIAPARPVTIVTDAQRLANSSAAVREQGAALPVVVGISHVTPKATGFAGFENPGAYGISQVTEATYPVGLENPAAYGTAWDSIGGPNEALHRQFSPPEEGAAPASGPDRIMVNGELCGQCR